MAWFKAMWLAGACGLFLMDWGSSATAAERHRDECRRRDRIRIEGLEMAPDPIMEGQRVRAWSARIRLAGDRECRTEIEIREAGEVIARAHRTHLRPGINDIRLTPVERYRFHGKEHCFRVVVDLEGTRAEVDAARRFCAHQRGSWSMQPREDFHAR